MRMRDEMRGKGTRGGARVHYLYVREAGVIYLLSVYGKHEQSSLTPAEKQVLRRLVQLLRDELHWRG